MKIDLKQVGGHLTGGYRELTVAAVVLGVLQGVVLNVAFVYAALKLGFSIPGSTVAAIMGYALLTGLMKRGTSVENNINQTIASGINTAGTGVVFTLPALYLLDAKLKAAGQGGLEWSLWPMIVGGIAGAILGTVFIIPLRKQMIEMDRLRFPSGVAVTTIIRAGRAGIDKALLLAVGFSISAIWKGILLSGWLQIPGVEQTGQLPHGFGVIGEDLYFGLGLIPQYVYPMVSLSLMSMAAGMLTGKGGLPFVVGGMLAWWVISPAAVNLGWTQGWAERAPDCKNLLEYIHGRMLQPLGIGTLIGGALMGVVVCFPAIVGALRSLASAAQTAKAGGESTGAEEMPLKFIVLGTILGMSLFFAGSLMCEGVSVAEAALGTVVGTVWLALAGLIVAQATGLTDISPMSGMALISVTLMMVLYENNIAAAMVVGVAVCVAIGQGADMMQDLKTGFMLGAKPIKQQIVQFAFTWLGVFVALGAVHVLWTNGPGGQGGFGNETLPAPQGGALMAVIEAIKTGNVPVDKYVMGGTIGVLLGAAPMPGLGVLIGLAMYLPFPITFGYGIGCLIHVGLQRAKGPAFCEHKLVPLAAGLIVGEALTGVGHATFVIVRSMLSQG